MAWIVEATDEFGRWWEELTEGEQIDVDTGRPYRVLYAFDPRRMAILLVGGEKTGDDRWYEKHAPIADRLYDEHLASLEPVETAKRKRKR